MELNFKQLKAALHTAPKKDVRYYLNGVFVEVRSGFYRIVSTDGSNMSVFHNAHDDAVADFDMIIPREVIDNLPKQIGLTVSLTQLDTNTYRLGSTIFTPIEGRYPDYRRVLPKETSGQTAHYPLNSLGAFGKIAATVGKSDARVDVWYNGTFGAAVTIEGHPEFLGITMPYGGEGKISKYPTWVHL